MTECVLETPWFSGGFL